MDVLLGIRTRGSRMVAYLSPSGKHLYFQNAKTTKTIMPEGQYPNFFDKCADKAFFFIY